HHEASDTLVIDELGLQHGKCRADIAVINGHLLGFEIKSDDDVLSRLPAQISAYNAVFDRVAIVAGERHISEVCGLVPPWWGIMLCRCGPRGGVQFSTQRRSSANPEVDLPSVAKLLWRSEAAQVLRDRGEEKKTLRSPRHVLYGRLVESLAADELRRVVRRSLRGRTSWRCQTQPSQCDG
ncbi:MAG: sce7726 family protein, partial [Lentisphaerae bacterium]|nr:sce7726 family protein [Lentisphaerota bacterium]